jgi:hypothetical protein
MPPEVSARFLADVMNAFVLPADIPSGVTSQFDKLKAMFCDGLFRYESFTQADRDTYRILEVALKARFLEHYGRELPVIVEGNPESRTVGSFDDVYKILGGRRPGKKAVLNAHPRFNGSFRALLQWAREEYYLYGQRNRLREGAMVDLRNDMQHGEHDTVLMPPDAARSIHLTFEMICRLWGHQGMPPFAYPGLLPRTPWVVGLGPTQGEATCFPIDHGALVSELAAPGWTWHVVLAVVDGELLQWRPSEVELLSIPVRQLWGPGSWAELKAEVARSASTWPADAVDILDRLFYFRVIGQETEMPRSGEQVKGLRDRRREERWLVVRADYPGDALGHARSALDGTHSLQGPCKQMCPAEGVLPLARRETIDRFMRDVVPRLSGPRWTL